MREREGLSESVRCTVTLLWPGQDLECLCPSRPLRSSPVPRPWPPPQLPPSPLAPPSTVSTPEFCSLSPHSKSQLPRAHMQCRFTLSNSNLQREASVAGIHLQQPVLACIPAPASNRKSSYACMGLHEPSTGPKYIGDGWCVLSYDCCTSIFESNLDFSSAERISVTTSSLTLLHLIQPLRSSAIPDYDDMIVESNSLKGV